MFRWFKKKEPEAVFIDLVPPPKVLRAPKLKPTTCEFCKAIYQGEICNLSTGMFSTVKRVIQCPICNSENLAEFEEGEGLDVDKLQEAINKYTKTHPVLLPENKNTGSRHIVCPRCRYLLRVDGNVFSTMWELHVSGKTRMYLPNNCRDCGQALDWSSLTEEDTDGNI